MNPLQILIWAFVAYCIYKVVFGFLLPVFRVTRQMKRKVREFQSQAEANGQFRNFQKDNISKPQERPAEKPAQKAGDYIDFEEIKEK